jgi:DNA-binding transcriptional regulator YiaG
MKAKEFVKFLEDNKLEAFSFSRLSNISTKTIEDWLTNGTPIWMDSVVKSIDFKTKLEEFKNKNTKHEAARIYLESGWKMIPAYEKSIASTHPVLIKEWDNEKNGVLKPEHFTKGSHDNIWWKCKNGHSFQKPIRERLRAKLIMCPTCSHSNVEISNNISITYPSLLKDWDYEKNVLSPTQLGPKSDKEVYWKCRYCKKEWKSRISNRTSSGNEIGGCATCTNLRRNVDPKKTLAILYPEVAAEWHPTLNKEFHISPEEIAPQSNLKVWWKCLKNGHEWQSKVQARTGRSKVVECPHCTGSHHINTYNLKISPLEIINFLFSNNLGKSKLSNLLHVRSTKVNEWINEEHPIPDQIRNKLDELQKILNKEKLND